MNASVERKIVEAIENGEFDNLPGHGEPLSLEILARDENLAHRLLVDHGFALPWIETKKEIEKDWTAASQRLAQRYYWLKRSGKSPEDSSSWANSVEKFRLEVEELNIRVDDYNLSVPLAQFQRPRLDAEAEILRLTSA